MRIIKARLHARQQASAIRFPETGEPEEGRLKHEGDEARALYGVLGVGTHRSDRVEAAGVRWVDGKSRSGVLGRASEIGPRERPGGIEQGPVSIADGRTIASAFEALL